MINCIFACDFNGVIGVNNQLPWDIKEDLEHFKNLTMNSTVIMGRKTFESIGKPLPKRQNIVVSSTLKNNVEVASSLQEAIKMAKNENIFVIGGSKLLEEAFAFCDNIYLTKINTVVNTKDKEFSKVNLSFMEYFTLKSIKTSCSNGYFYDFLVFSRN